MTEPVGHSPHPGKLDNVRQDSINGISHEQERKIYPVELVGEWSIDIPPSIRTMTEDVISWKKPHEASWYPVPGRTLFLDSGEGYKLKIKGAGFYNPSNVSFSGTRRTITPVPEGDTPMPPLERLFERDLVHTDPSTTPPHLLESVHSIFAPIGGITRDAALHDQVMFTRLTTAGIPANFPGASYRYLDLKLDNKPMGVSVSVLPPDMLSATAYNLYLKDQLGVTPEALEFLKEYSGKGNAFSFENPSHRLEVLAKLATVAGKLLFDFSAKAGLYRFSGGPDNWNIKRDLNNPLFFSDVDTSRTLESISPMQQGWEVLRNLNSAIHNWYYYFIPTVSYKESGYTAETLRQKQHDFVGSMLQGFFQEKSPDEVDKASRRIWRFFDLPLREAAKETNMGLRRGENFLQQYYPRPVFHFVMLSQLSELIQDSEFQRKFPDTDTSPRGIQQYIDMSSQHESHSRMFPNYSPSQAQATVQNFLRDIN